MNHKQPFSCVASSSAIQKPITLPRGSVCRNVASWCGVTAARGAGWGLGKPLEPSTTRTGHLVLLDLTYPGLPPITHINSNTKASPFSLLQRSS